MDTELEWFEFNAGRNTYSVLLHQPFADLVVELIDRAKAWRDAPSEMSAAALAAALGRVEQAQPKDRLEKGVVLP